MHAEKAYCIFETMLFEHINAEETLFFILYGITGTVPFIAALYLLLRRGNAFASDVTPPVRLHRWAASFFAVAALGHVWWYLFYLYSADVHSVSYVATVILDCVTLMTTIAGTLLAMLQDRKRPVWPAFAAMIPFVVLGVLHVLYPDGAFMNIASFYILSLYVLFSVYMVFAVRQYGRWLNDNYADLEDKKVWLFQVVSLFCLLLMILYTFVDADNYLIFLLHVIELVLFALLLWRVETLPTLQTLPQSIPVMEGSGCEEQGAESSNGGEVFPHLEQMLQMHCVETQLYLQHDLSLQQLAQAIGTNRSYLSLYFAGQGITYNSYINNLRINHFISRYQEVAASKQTVIAQKLAQESGFRSYSTFSLAFKQRMGQTVTAWMREQQSKNSETR